MKEQPISYCFVCTGCGIKMYAKNSKRKLLSVRFAKVFVHT